MHFFGSLGTLCFLLGFLITSWLVIEKVYFSFKNLAARDVTDQPLFFLALVAVVVGVQLFLAGFLAEMISLTGSKKNEYLIRDNIGL